MGKFINKSYVNTIDSLTTGMTEKVKNANYVFNNNPPVICDWYNINKDSTIINRDSGLEYSHIGKDSPFRFSKIKDAVFYSEGSIKIEFNLMYEENGLEVDAPNISGIILPNTWIPYSGDHFYLKQSGRKWLYRVNTVTYDTIDNGNNVYRFEASLSQSGDESTNQIDKQVDSTYRMIINNVGTGLNPIIKETIYDCIDKLDDMLIRLKENYIALFYNDTVQTFTYTNRHGRLYDPYLIEFMIRNKILSGIKEYVYVHHEVPIPRTFSIDYMGTMFRALETKTIQNFNNQKSYMEHIDNIYSLFNTTRENYFMIKHTNNLIGRGVFQPVDPELVSNVKNNIITETEDNPKAFYNIITMYMNGTLLDSKVIAMLENIEFKPDYIHFYGLPILIFSLEESIKNLMK